MTEDAFRAAFGAALDRQLRGHGKTRYALAKALGVSTSYVSQAATGKKPVTPTLANRIGSAIEATEEELAELHRAAALSRGYRFKP